MQSLLRKNACGAQQCRAALGPRTAHRPCRQVVMQSNNEGGVGDLLSRDRKEPKLAPELDNIGFVPQPKNRKEKELLEAKKAKEIREREQVVKSRKQRQEDIAKAAVNRADPNRPKSSKQAIDKGLELFQGQKYQEAVDMFNIALELPGNGAYRLAGTVREFSCPSDAEENAALYNMACAYVKLGRKAGALTCIEAVLDNDFKDFNTLRTDPDLADVRGAELDALINKYDNPLAKVQTLFNVNQKPKPEQSNTNKPWLLW